jgi:hypothetical protein
MIKRIFRWRHWRARAKFWRHRALKAEASLEAEMWRNRAREDELITVPQRMAGLWGMPPRSEPAVVKQVNASPSRALTAPADPWDGLTGTEKWEFDMEWKQAAEAAGIPLAQAKQDFMNEIAMRRQPLNDDPYGQTN